MFINNRYFFAHCFFSTKKKTCKKNLAEGVCFARKIENFSCKTHSLQRKHFPARLLSEAKNSA